MIATVQLEPDREYNYPALTGCEGGGGELVRYCAVSGTVLSQVLCCLRYCAVSGTVLCCGVSLGNQKKRLDTNCAPGITGASIPLVIDGISLIFFAYHGLV